MQKSLAPLISLRKLILQCNQQFDLVLPQGSFESLEVDHESMTLQFCSVLVSSLQVSS